MGSPTPKVLLPVGGRAVLAHVLDAVRDAGADRVIAVVGVGREQVTGQFAGAGVEFAVQAEPLGTADAVLACRSLLRGDEECVVVYGDVPLMRGSTIRRLVDARGQTGADVTVLTAVLDDPFGYGRVVRDQDGWVTAIVEQRDADEPTRRIREVNSGLYSFRWGRLLPELERVRPSAASGEYYLTDAVCGVRQSGGRVAAVLMDDPDEMHGINTPGQLAEVAALLDARRRER